MAFRRVLMGLCVVAAAARFEPMPVSLGEIMAKIEQGAAKDEILKQIEALQRRVEGEVANGQLIDEEMATGLCSDNSFNSTILASIDTNHTATTEIGKLRAHNQVIESEYMPAGEANISALETTIKERQDEMLVLKEKRANETAAWLVKRDELDQALEVIDEVSKIVHTSSLSDNLNEKAFVQSGGLATVRSSLEAEAKVAIGFKKHLLNSALGVLSPKGDSIDKIDNLLSQMRNDFRSSRQTAYQDESTTATKYYYYMQTEAGEIKTQQGAAIALAKQVMSQLMQEFADNDIAAAVLSETRTIAVGNMMIAYIDEADRTKRCADHAVSSQTNNARWEQEKIDLTNIHAAVTAMEFGNSVGSVDLSSVVPAQAECYCDSLCGEKSDCCQDCKDGKKVETIEAPKTQDGNTTEAPKPQGGEGGNTTEPF